jgi:hypothetical protein
MRKMQAICESCPSCQWSSFGPGAKTGEDWPKTFFARVEISFPRSRINRMLKLGQIQIKAPPGAAQPCPNAGVWLH